MDSSTESASQFDVDSEPDFQDSQVAVLESTADLVDSVVDGVDSQVDDVDTGVDFQKLGQSDFLAGGVSEIEEGSTIEVGGASRGGATEGGVSKAALVEVVSTHRFLASGVFKI